MVVGVGSSWIIYIKCGTLALRSPRAASEAIVQPIVDKWFQQPSSSAKRILYLCADESITKGSSDPFYTLSNLSGAIYGNPFLTNSNVDSRFLLHIGNKSLSSESFEKVLLCHDDDNPDGGLLEKFERKFSKPENFEFLKLPSVSDVELDSNTKPKVGFKKHKEVCLGGTFDRIHAGHKQLLTAACLACSHRLTVGVTSGPMIARKTLNELIQPVEKRIAEVKSFVNEIDPTIEANVVPIVDAFGPSIEIEHLGVLVVSQETLRGGEKVNEERVKRGLPPAQVHVIELLGQGGDFSQAETQPVIDFKPDEDSLDGNVPKPPIEEENKVSSSTQRFHLLGQLLQPARNIRSPKGPYVIGLTGGIASGKTSVSARLEKLGAKIIDCDKLGHEVYQKENPAFAEIVAEFGPDVINASTGEIDRRKLGSIVFGDKQALKRLCSITWPKIASRMNQCIDEIALADEKYNEQHSNEPTKRSIVIVNAAVLLEANWDTDFHEVWLCIAPYDEEIKRVMARDKLTEADAKLRMAAQMSNSERVARAHVVISTNWRRSVTQYQVEKAWRLLNERTNCSA